MKLSSAIKRPTAHKPITSASTATVAATALVSLALLATPASALLSCNSIQDGGQRWDFSELRGPHSVVTWQKQEPQPWEFVNTTYTLDLCAPLKKEGPADESCPNGARVCGIKRGRRPEQKEYEVFEVASLAGDLQNHGVSRGLDAKITRLRTSESTSDSKKEGVRIALNGGRRPLARGGREQRVIIEMVCNPDMVGTEGEWDTSKDGYEQGPIDETTPKEGNDGDDAPPPAVAAAAEEGGDGNGDNGEVDTTERQLLKNDSALLFDSYAPLAGDANVDVLRLTWQTKFACESQADTGSPRKPEHWGFFTWMFLLVFLATAAYLIFGSWLNYTRYGARGWDLLPHGDTIRDIPYLFQDWTRRVLNTVQGTGSRGGYAAV